VDANSRLTFRNAGFAGGSCLSENLGKAQTIRAPIVKQEHELPLVNCVAAGTFLSVPCSQTYKSGSSPYTAVRYRTSYVVLNMVRLSISILRHHLIDGINSLTT
jgi:hypothetical protein